MNAVGIDVLMAAKIGLVLGVWMLPAIVWSALCAVRHARHHTFTRVDRQVGLFLAMVGMLGFLLVP